MKAARISAYQAQLVIEDAPVPTTGPGEVLVRIAAAGLNPLDTKIQQGFMHDFFPVAFPYTLGTDLAGTVEQVGADVTGWTIGDRVVARTDPPAGGALAEIAVVPATHLARLPASVATEQAAGVPTAAGTFAGLVLVFVLVHDPLTTTEDEQEHEQDYGEHTRLTRLSY